MVVSADHPLRLPSAVALRHAAAMQTPRRRAFAIAAFLTGCSPDEVQKPDERQLRWLTTTWPSAKARPAYAVPGVPVPTPSDPTARYFLLDRRTRLPAGTTIAVIRKEQRARIAYVRLEVDCSARTMRIAGIANRRSFVEVGSWGREAMRPIADLPLRQDLSAAICSPS